MESILKAYGCTEEEFNEWIEFVASKGIDVSDVNAAILQTESDHNLSASHFIGTVDAGDDPFLPDGARNLSDALTKKLSEYQRHAVMIVKQTGEDAVILRKGYNMAVCLKRSDSDRITALKRNGCHVFRTILYRQERRKW